MSATVSFRNENAEDDNIDEIDESETSIDDKNDRIKLYERQAEEATKKILSDLKVIYDIEKKKEKVIKSKETGEKVKKVKKKKKSAEQNDPNDNLDGGGRKKAKTYEKVKPFFTYRALDAATRLI